MKRTTYAIVLLIAALLGALSRPDAASASPLDCAPVDVSVMPIEQVAQLMDAGWEGDPGDGTEALYPPACDAPDSWPLGAALDTVTYVTLPAMFDLVPVVAWPARMVTDGWTLLPPGTILDPAGVDRGPCLAQVGDTTVVECLDGYATTS